MCVVRCAQRTGGVAAAATPREARARRAQSCGARAAHHIYIAARPARGLRAVARGVYAACGGRMAAARALRADVPRANTYMCLRYCLSPTPVG